jgi:hypothetical protein
VSGKSETIDSPCTSIAYRQDSCCLNLYTAEVDVDSIWSASGHSGLDDRERAIGEADLLTQGEACQASAADRSKKWRKVSKCTSKGMPPATPQQALPVGTLPWVAHCWVGVSAMPEEVASSKVTVIVLASLMLVLAFATTGPVATTPGRCVSLAKASASLRPTSVLFRGWI